MALAEYFVVIACAFGVHCVIANQDSWFGIVC